MVLEDRRALWIGLGLAVSGSCAIGTSFIITKKGLIDAAERHSGFSSDSYSYLQNVTWWAGMITMVVGEVANFAAYAFAPPILVTPLGALSVLIGAVLASVFLKEELGRIGRVGCTLCLVGSLVIVLHAPEDKDVTTVDEILTYFLQPAFLFYSLCVLAFSLYMIYVVSPRYGTRTPLVYLSICSLVGSISVMAIKGLGVALKLTFAGMNQLTHLPTYVFAIVTAGCIVVQMNYFNKALDLFSTNVVNPIYYVCFSTATIVASLILFQGVQTESARDSASLVAGFVTIFLGVYLLNISRADPHGVNFNSGTAHRHSLLETRMSMSGARMSVEDGHQALPLHGRGGARRSMGRHHANDSTSSLRSPTTPSGLKRASIISDDEVEDDFVDGAPVDGVSAMPTLSGRDETSGGRVRGGEEAAWNTGGAAMASQPGHGRQTGRAGGRTSTSGHGLPNGRPGPTTR